MFGLAIYIEWYVVDQVFLGYFTLFFGVFVGFYSVKDIYDGEFLRLVWLLRGRVRQCFENSTFANKIAQIQFVERPMAAML